MVGYNYVQLSMDSLTCVFFKKSSPHLIARPSDNLENFSKQVHALILGVVQFLFCFRLSQQEIMNEKQPSLSSLERID